MNKTLKAKVAATAATTGLAVAALMGVAGPASAATTGGTIATFAITGGALNITVPASTVALTGATVGTGASSVAGQLGAVSVTDTRGALLTGWTVTVGSTSFVTGTATPNETVATGKVAYSSGPSTTTSGLGAFVPGTLATLTAAGTGASWTGVAGNDSATWNPTLTFTLLASQVAGTYSGTVTHSVG